MPCTVVLGAQWGDEGKGKIVDVLAAEHDLVVRYQGGSNAGHSVVVDGRTVVLRLVPSGILRPDKRCFLGNGVVVDPAAFLEEMEGLTALGLRLEGRLLVSPEAHVILPYHKIIESEAEHGLRPVGTTGRGIGPAYQDKAGRFGLRMADLLDRSALDPLVGWAHERLKRLLGGTAAIPPAGEVADQYAEFGERLRPFIADVRAPLWEAVSRGQRVLLEGAQGTLLDVDHGTYPYVTSSSATVGGALTGTGLGPHAITRVLGVTKAYTTRVGHGPFPTELDAAMADAIREVGHEYGAVTGRARRCGWLDAVALRYAAQVNGLDELVVTKLDVLDDLPEIQVATRYRSGAEDAVFTPDARRLALLSPVYETFEGWRANTSRCRRFIDLPVAARGYVRAIESWAGVPVSAVSVGPEREAMIEVPPLA
jgi:adenylosuccinate synthase